MPIYNYRALKSDGRTVRGKLFARDAELLKLELDAKGLLLSSNSAAGSLRFFETTSDDDFLLCVQELAALLKAGLTLPESLDIVSDRPGSARLSRQLKEVVDAVRTGTSFSGACQAVGGPFEPLFVAALVTAERTGDFPSALEGYHDYLSQRLALRSRVTQALAYPIVLIFALTLILTVLFTFALPRFVHLYKDFGAELPLATRVLMAVVDRLPWIAGAICASLAGTWLLWRAAKSRPMGRELLIKFISGIPVLGDLRQGFLAARLSRGLAALVGSGMPPAQALDAARFSVAGRLEEDRFDRARDRVLRGQGLASAFRQEQLLPHAALKLIETGEASGKLGEMLKQVAKFYEDSLSARLGRAVSLLEPALILVTGAIVGAVIIAMYLPIFRLAEVIR